MKTDLPKIIAKLSAAYPNAECALHHKNAYELLIATILSAQCTDKRVNMVTPNLFAKYPNPAALAKAPLKDVEKLIQSTGFFRQKAKSIVETSRGLIEKFNGEVPSTLKELTELRGVARKTANVVLGVVYKISEGIVVDTHVRRLSFRLGLTKQTDPKKIEIDLCKIVPKENWITFSHWLILHGREICMARNPQCLRCPILDICPRKGLKPLSKPAAEIDYESLVSKRAIRPKKR